MINEHLDVRGINPLFPLARTEGLEILSYLGHLGFRQLQPDPEIAAGALNGFPGLAATDSPHVDPSQSLGRTADQLPESSQSSLQICSVADQHPNARMIQIVNGLKIPNKAFCLSFISCRQNILKLINDQKNAPRNDRNSGLL